MRALHKITIFGAGAMGSTLAAWLTAQGQDVSLVARGDYAEQLRRAPVRILHKGKVAQKPVMVSATNDIRDAGNADILIITVKNFDLESCCRQIAEHINKDTLVVGLQNGVVNQTILPKYFRNVAYAVSNYNAWRTPNDAAGSGGTIDWNVNYNGPLIFGSTDVRLQEPIDRLVDLCSDFIRCYRSERISDDAHAKLVNNLGNSITTVIGNTHLESASLAPLHWVFTRVIYEGVRVLRKAGIQPSRKGALPSWRAVFLARFLPAMFTRRVFQKRLAMIGSTSMATDVLSKGSGRSELETINGAILALAEKHHVKAPYNRRLYDLCRERFSQTPFQPISAEDLKRRLQGKR